MAHKALRGGLYTVSSTAVNFVALTITTVFITRQLTDRDFGLYGMVLVLTGFAGMFVDLGLSRAVVQQPKVSSQQVSTLFWINLSIAGLLASLVASLTPAVVWFFDEPSLAPINLAMSGLFLVSALGLQHRALLERRMEFGKLSFIALVAPLAGAVVGLWLAVEGGGVWALVAIPAVGQFAATAGAWAFCSWIPGAPKRGSGVRRMLAFGGHVTGFQFINYFARNADNAAIGNVWGAAPLGLYTRAYSLMLLPASRLNGPLTGVVVPLLSRMTDDPDRYRAAYRRCLALSATYSTVGILFGFIVAEEAIPVVLGEQWECMVPIFLALAPAAVMTCTNAAAGWLYLSCGHVQQMWRWSIFSTACLAVSFAGGIQYGPWGMAVAVSIVQTLLKFPSLVYAARSTPVRPVDLVNSLWLPTVVPSVGAGLAIVGAHVWLGDLGDLTRVAAKVALYASSLTVCYLMIGRWRSMVNDLKQVRDLRRGGAAA